MIPDTSSQDRKIQPKSKWVKWRWLLLVGVAILLLAFFMRSRLAELGTIQRSVARNSLRFATAELGDMIREVSVEGRIVAASFPTLYAPAEGTVTFHVRPGQRVTENQLLASIESPQLENRMAQEQSALAALKADLDRIKIEAETSVLEQVQQNALRELRHAAAQRALDRAERSHKLGLINQSDYEAAQDDQAIAQLEYQNGLESLKLMKKRQEVEIRGLAAQEERQELIVSNLQREVQALQIRATVNGMVGNTLAAQSDYVADNAPLLTVVDLTSLEIEIQIPETYADEILPNTSAQISYEGKTFEGRVSHVSPEVQQSMVVGRVTFTGDVPSGLKQNQRVTSRILLDHIEGVVKVKRGPFMEQFHGRAVFKVENNVATKTPIQAGKTSLSEVAIDSGLQPGDQIILSDLSRFQDVESLLVRD